MVSVDADGFSSAIGVKLVKFKPMTFGEYSEFHANESPPRDGYMVKYSDEYVSWCPKDVFDRQNFIVNSGDKVDIEDVERMIADIKYTNINNKNTLATVTLQNSFQMIRTSGVVNPSGYNHEKGCEVVRETVIGDVWYLLGFLLQCARDGFNYKNT
jgi:hypothetical protein